MRLKDEKITQAKVNAAYHKATKNGSNALCGLCRSSLAGWMEILTVLVKEQLYRSFLTGWMKFFVPLQHN